MTPILLFILSSDPRTSHRPAEAIRIAAGIGVWKMVQIKIYLRGAAVLPLIEDDHDLVDEETYRLHFANLESFARPIYVQRGAPLLDTPVESRFTFEEIDDAQLAALAANCNYVLRF